MLKFNKIISPNTLRHNPLLAKHLSKGMSLRKFCEKIKPEDQIQRSDQNQGEEEQHKSETRRNIYTYLRKLRRFLSTLIRYGFYTGCGLFIGNLMIYKKYEFAEKNLEIIKMDFFQSSIHKMSFVKQFFVDLGTGFEIERRPGLSKFLQELSEHYEIVVFDNMDSMFIDQLCDILDPFKVNIFYRLGKEATRLENGKYIKDLRFLNRNLGRVIVLDFDPESVKYHPENLIIVPEYNGDPNDRELVHMIHFLIAISKPNVKDVRKELDKYGHFKPHIRFYKSDKKYSKLVPAEYQEKDIIDDDYGKGIIKKV